MWGYAGVYVCICVNICVVCIYVVCVHVWGDWQGLGSEAEKKEKHPTRPVQGCLVEMLDPACVLLSCCVRGWMRESRRDRRGCRMEGQRERGAQEGRDSEKLGLFPSSLASGESPRAGRRVTVTPVRRVAWS